jgi:resuscitation-promoting factor RpfA
MLSGNGRHRRPRQVPALVVAAGVTGSAIAIPLLGATGASAADITVDVNTTVDANTWDRLADCESGGAWSADSGNGYYGGLQLTQETWEDFGGLEYAPSADQASRAQQVAVAEKVLAEQGPLAWPTCGLVAGFPTDSATDPADEPETDPSQPVEEPTEEPTAEDPTATPDDPSTDAPSDETPTGDTSGESGDEGHDGAADETDNSGQSGSGRHRGEPAPDDSGGDRDDNSAGRHADRGDDSRGDAEGTYTVRPGDNLSAIADARGIDGGWAALYAANEDAVGADPDLILPGQRLDLGAN